jgi:hypothetical protein
MHKDQRRVNVLLRKLALLGLLVLYFGMILAPRGFSDLDKDLW